MKYRYPHLVWGLLAVLVLNLFLSVLLLFREEPSSTSQWKQEELQKLQKRWQTWLEKERENWHKQVEEKWQERLQSLEFQLERKVELKLREERQQYRSRWQQLEKKMADLERALSQLEKGKGSDVADQYGQILELLRQIQKSLEDLRKKK